MSDAASGRSSLAGLLGQFGRLGATAFGGPAAHVAMMEDEFVQRRRWLDRDTFARALAATNLVPGPNSTEMAIHLGYRRRGVPGSDRLGKRLHLPGRARRRGARLGLLPVGHHAARRRPVRGHPPRRRRARRARRLAAARPRRAQPALDGPRGLSLRDRAARAALGGDRAARCWRGRPARERAGTAPPAPARGRRPPRAAAPAGAARARRHAARGRADRAHSPQGRARCSSAAAT